MGKHVYTFCDFHQVTFNHEKLPSASAVIVSLLEVMLNLFHCESFNTLFKLHP